MELQIDSETTDVRFDAGNENTINDLQNVTSSKTQERQMTPTDSCCRICYQRNLQEPNLSLCGCRGTLKLVHKSCLESWLASSRHGKCELCGFRFNLRKKRKYGVFRAIVIWLMLKRSREDRIIMALDILKLSTAVAMLLVINYQTLTLLGNIQQSDMSLQDFINPFFEPVLNWNDLVDVSSKILKIFSLAMAMPMTLDFIATKLHVLDLYISQWYRWYEAEVVVKLIPS